MATEVGSLVPKRKGELTVSPLPRASKRKREQTVLDEDEWLEKLEAIIQRDYYPDLPKLESELEWLEAVRTKDPVLIRQAQANIVKRRAGFRTPMGQTPASFATPAIDGTPRAPGGGEVTKQHEEADNSAPAPKMSLDKFMAWHTSEDNASFAEILEGINKRRREKYAWAHSAQDAKQLKLLEDARPLDGFGTSGQPNGALLNWPHVPENALYYGSEGVPFSEKELKLQIQGAPKEISSVNTRMPGSASEDVDLSTVKRPERGDGYDRIATPSFTPGPDAPPPMTWGRLEATPARVEDDSAGPHFRVPDRKPKDILAHRLADGARLNLQKRAALMSPSALHSLQRKTPRVRTSMTPRLSGSRLAFSPAAHRLASSLRGSKGVPADMALRASYSRSALRRASTGPTPAVTPGPSETPAILHEERDHRLSSASRSPKLAKSAASSEEERLRAAAVRAFAPDAARNHALKAFESTVARDNALRSLGKITDDLLDI